VGQEVWANGGRGTRGTEYAAYCKPDDRGRKKTANLASFRTYFKASLGRLEFLVSRLLNPRRAVHRWREARTWMRALAHG